METQLQSTRVLLQLLSGDVDTNSISGILRKLGHQDDFIEEKAWETYLIESCNELVRLAEYLTTAKPTFVKENEKSDKFVVLNHMNLEQTSIAASLIELVTLWGLVPFLSFSIPIESRNKENVVRIRQMPLKVVQSLSINNDIPLKSLKALYGCLSCRELHQMAIDCALVDVIPAFVKFGFEKTNLDVSEVQWCNQNFKSLVSNPVVGATPLARLLLLHLSLKPQNQTFIRVLSSSLYMLICERSDGLVGTLAALLDSRSGVVNMEAVAMAAKTVANPPERLQNEHYFQKLCPQLVAVLRSKRTSSNDKFVACASDIFRIWSSTHPTLTTRLWLIPVASPFLPFLALYLSNQASQASDPVLRYLSGHPSQSTPTIRNAKKPKIQLIEDIPVPTPLPSPTLSEWKLQDLKSWNNKEGIIVHQPIIEMAVSNLTLLLLSVDNVDYFPQFEPIIPTMVALHALSIGKKACSALEKDTSSFLQRFFMLCSPDRAIQLLNYLTFNADFDWRRLYASEPGGKLENGFRFEFAEVQGNIVITAAALPETPENDVTSELRTSGDHLVQLLKILDGDLAGIFFLKLLEELFTTMTVIKSLSDDSQPLQLTSVDDRLQVFNLLTEKQLKMMHLLMPLIEQMGPSVLRNTIQICVFIKDMLESEGEEEIQALCLSILKEILETKIVTRSEADILLIDMLSPLKTLFTSSNDFVSQMSHYCYEEIEKYLSRDLSSNDSNNDAKTEPQTSNQGEEKPKRRWILDPHAASVQDALKMISNPLVPIRAGGLIQLRRFLLKEDPEAMSRLPSILDTFVQHLSNEDSYVYLGAIQGLSAIADVQFNLAMPKLMEEYRNTKRSLEIRLNVGEAILQVARRLGAVLPKYAEQFFSLLLTSAQKDPEALIRASSLSNIAEVCEILKYGLLPFIEEIMAMIYDILMVEKDDHVRRGCVNLVKQLFKGLEKDALSIIPGHIKRITSLLQLIQDTDKDYILREHAKIALQLYHSGIDAAIEAATSNPQLLDPQGFYSSLRIVK